MPFTFECGVCHAVYRLDEHQITATGVKVTCPKCLNYFFLKRGGVESTESPVVEYVIPDGAYDLSAKAAEKPKPEAATRPLPPPPLPPPPKPVHIPIPTEKTLITEADLSDLPPDPPTTTAGDQYLMLLLGIIIVLASLVYLNFTGFISIPGFEKFKKKEQTLLPPPAITPLSQKTPKFGFPQVDPGYNTWTGKPNTPVPQATAADSNGVK